jgi:hypothetical protein
MMTILLFAMAGTGGSATYGAGVPRRMGNFVR